MLFFGVAKMGENYNKPSLYLILPCFNEEEILSKTADETESKLNQLIMEIKYPIQVRFYLWMMVHLIILGS